VEREVLERAIAVGRIDPADYEAAHIRFVQCMNQHDFQPTYRKTSDGLYVELPYLSISNQEVFDAANAKCSEDNVTVEILYRTQQANPDLWSDSRRVAVQCLMKRGFVEVGYTVDDFSRDLSGDTFPFNADEGEANGCLYGAGYAYFTVEG
jgi:hypothetical protein